LTSAEKQKLTHLSTYQHNTSQRNNNAILLYYSAIIQQRRLLLFFVHVPISLEIHGKTGFLPIWGMNAFNIGDPLISLHLVIFSLMSLRLLGVTEN